jgi:type VI secretion system secreted protein VgrG
MPFTQENRLIAIDTPLGEDVLLLRGFSGIEEISAPFRFELDMLSENHEITFKDIIGKNVTVSIVLANGETRYFNGIISRFSQGRGGGESGGSPRFSCYTATMVPWLWLLSKTANSRIFQGLSVPEIVERIFSEKNFSDYKFLLHGNYDKREYCVQYRETDFNFISRLLEEEGIYYFFEHEQGKHTLILADTPEEHKPCPNQESAHYHTSAGGRLEEDTITSLEVTQEITAGKYTLNDFNFETPNTDLKIEIPSSQSLGPGEREIYDYPGGYTKRAEGDRLANIRMQEEEAEITTIIGSSTCRAFTSGYRFTLQEHYREDMNKDYVLISVSHDASQGYEPGDGGAEFSYVNNFICIPFEIPFRPQRRTPKPIVEGVQTAIVVGPQGEEIYTDEHGRVKVQFHWDREGGRNENSSCWIRVSQVWAGAGWGAMYIPRIGHEVIVDFIEGDPDRPIVIGRVYHGTNRPPYDLPGEKTKSTIKSDSTPGGGGSNEFRFEDKKGSEEIYLHGQKDWTIVIENDKNQTIGNNESLKVGNNQSETIGSNKSIKVGADHNESIGANKTLSVGANHTETIGANMSLTVGNNQTENIGMGKSLTIGTAYQVSVGAAMNETIGAAKAEEIGATKSVSVGGNSSENVGANKSVTAGGSISESAGKDISIQAGKNISLNAGDDFSIKGDKKGVIEIKDQLTIKCGKASITLKKNGDISISGKKINIKGSGDIIMKAKKILEN